MRRTIALGAGLIALTLGLATVPSAAQDRGMASKAALANVIVIPIKRLPVIDHFYPEHVNADREFAGHGPDVVATASLGGVGTSRKLTVTLCMSAQETEDNYTRAEGCETYLLYQAPPGQCIATASHGTFDEFHYFDIDHDLDKLDRFDSPNFVQRWEATGDTEFENDAGDRTGVNIETFPLSITTGPGGCQ